MPKQEYDPREVLQSKVLDDQLWTANDVVIVETGFEVVDGQIIPGTRVTRLEFDTYEDLVNWRENALWIHSERLVAADDGKSWT